MEKRSMYYPGTEVWRGSPQDPSHILQFVWTLQNFSNLPIYMCSNERYTECQSKTLWRAELHFYPSSRKENSMEICAKLHRTDRRGISVQASFQLLLMDRTGKILFEASYNSVFPCRLTSNTSSISIWVENKALFSLPDDELTIRFHLVVSGCCRTTEVFHEIFLANGNTKRNLNVHLAQLQRDFRKAYESELLADVELISGKHVIRANKFMLCARSPVFKRALEHKNKSKIRYDFDSTGRKISALEPFMSYLYTGYSKNVSLCTTYELYSIASKYEVRSLQHACSQIIFSNLNINSVCEILKLAEKHGDVTLKEVAMTFLRSNFKQITSTVYWKSLVEDFPNLHADILNCICASDQS